MSFINNRFVTFCAVLGLGFTTPAYSATVSVTYTGTATGTDLRNTLGLGNVFSIAPFVSNYLFDTTKGAIHNSPTQNYTVGSGINSPLISSSITINGHTIQTSGGNLGELYVLSDGIVYQIATYAEYSNIVNNIYIVDKLDMGGVINNSSASSSLTGPFDGAINGNGLFGYYRANATLQNIFTNINADLTIQHVTIGIVGGVPEASSWTMMIVGFGIAGMAFRYRRRYDPRVARLAGGGRS